MGQVRRLERLLEDVYSGADEAVVASAIELLELGEFGSPAGTYLLAGGKAALRIGRLADAVVLLYHGLRVAEPYTQVWAELLVNRASACAHHGFCRDAISAGDQFFGAINRVPAEARKYVPYAHHAMGFAYDKLKEHTKAATHFRLAVEAYEDIAQRAIAACDLAWALTLANRVQEAKLVLSQVPGTSDDYASFVQSGTAALVYYHQQRYSEAVTAAQRCEGLALGHESAWANSLAEVQYWLSRAVWELGDRYRAAALALRVAIVADQHWNLDLRDRASDWLAQIMEMGGIDDA